VTGGERLSADEETGIGQRTDTRGRLVAGGRSWCVAAPSRRRDQYSTKAGRRGRGAMSSQPGKEDKRRPPRSAGAPAFAAATRGRPRGTMDVRRRRLSTVLRAIRRSPARLL